ncbi:MAG: hypothetical protein QJR00_04745, partial [Bacillota bacterium]|nr:hypothetical protein [Bacillota bacterium]
MRRKILILAVTLLVGTGISSPVAASWYIRPAPLPAKAPAILPPAPGPFPAISEGGSGGDLVPPLGAAWGSEGEIGYVVERLRVLRESQGLSPLAVDPALMKLASLRLQDLLSHGLFTHDTPTYGSALQMMKDLGLSYRVLGAENLAAHRSVAWAEMALEASPL